VCALCDGTIDSGEGKGVFGVGCCVEGGWACNTSDVGSGEGDVRQEGDEESELEEHGGRRFRNGVH
jgi:hypothetical protein